MDRYINRNTSAISRGQKPKTYQAWFKGRRGGIRIESAEGLSFYRGSLIDELGQTAVEAAEPKPAPGIVSVDIIDEGNTALLGIRQVSGEIINFTVPTRPLVEVELPEERPNS